MTWKQIKELIESNGISDDDVVDCIDASFWDDTEVNVVEDGYYDGCLKEYVKQYGIYK